MTYVAREAREEPLETVAEAIDELGAAVAALGAAYERLDDRNADRLEDALFRPVQLAYGRAKRTYTGFADRHALSARTFSAAAPPGPSQGVRELLDGAVDAVA